MDVLGVHADAALRPEPLQGRLERDERRADDDLDAREALGEPADLRGELARLVRPLVHLPVAGDEHQPSSSGYRRHAGQLLALEELERRAAAGRDPRDPVGEPELVERAYRVAAADDRVPVTAATASRHGLRALREARPLEDAHRAVPEDGPSPIRRISAKRFRVSGPMSSPSQPSGRSS